MPSEQEIKKYEPRSIYDIYSNIDFYNLIREGENKIYHLLERLKELLSFTNGQPTIQTEENSQETYRINYAGLIYNTFCVLALYRQYNCSPFIPQTDKLFDDFLYRVYLPFFDGSHNNANNNDYNSSCSKLLQSFIVSVYNLNLYINCSISLPNGTTQTYTIEVDDFSLNVVKRVLLYNDFIREIKEPEKALLNTKSRDWNNNLFNKLIDILREYKEARLPCSEHKFDFYRHCSIVINNTFYIYEMIDGKPTLTGDVGEITHSPKLENTFYEATPPCQRMKIIPIIEKLEANMENILKHLHYFTMGDKNTFDKMALDFVHSIMNPTFKRRNTIVSGDRMKLELWIKLMQDMMSYTELFNRGYFILNSKTPKNLLEAFMDQKCIYSKKSDYNIPINTNPLHHFYYYCNENEKPSEMDKGNKYIHLEFKYGQNNFNLDWLNPDDVILLTQLFFAHGWHILNKAAKSHKAKSNNIEKNIEKEFIENFLCKDGTYTVDGIERCDKNGNPLFIRLPLALVHGLYKAYSANESGKNTVALSIDKLREMLVEHYSFSYSSQKTREADIEYISRQLQPYMEKLGLEFDENWIKSGTRRILNCTIKDEFWKALTSSSGNYENDNTDYGSFDAYIKELYSRYQGMFIYQKVPHRNNKADSKKLGS